MQDPIVRKLGKYEIIGELGKGGFATVYRACDLDLEREVALKVLDPLLTRDPVWVARFRREARAVANLDHPRIVTVYDVGQAEGVVYIAMKLVEGGSLAQRITQQGALSWNDVVTTTSQAAEALDFAHAQGVLHRDLKPANILLDPRNGAVLSDFGFARLLADNSMSMSLSGGVVGTPAYIAPEIWKARSSDRRRTSMPWDVSSRNWLRARPCSQATRLRPSCAPIFSPSSCPTNGPRARRPA